VLVSRERSRANPEDISEPSAHVTRFKNSGRNNLSVRMVAGFAELAKRKEFLVAGGRYVPNRQLLSIPPRSEFAHCRA
jgi:hypothetical protein